MTSEFKKIIVCDDDKGILDVSSIVIRDLGFDILPVSNSEKIFDKIAEYKPDLLLLDLWMPNIGGAEIIKTLRTNEATQHIKIIIISATKDVTEIAQELEVDDFISKPFDISELEEKVLKYLA